ncbi:MAG: biotin transporter BioY [Bacillota bacterium]|nr:biotin transporter BioY [Bacillota bacterium]
MNAQMTHKSKTTIMALCGLFAAVMTVCSWISIPLGFTPVPVNLATLGVFLTGALLGPKYGTLSMAVYTLAGAVGLPVFSEFRGGLSVLAGPTGGYIVGYIAAAFISGIIVAAAVKTEKTPVVSITMYVAAMILGLLACYALGTAWFMFTTHTPLGAAMVTCVIPFLPGDALKIAAGTILARRLKKYI